MLTYQPISFCYNYGGILCQLDGTVRLSTSAPHSFLSSTCELFILVGTCDTELVG